MPTKAVFTTEKQFLEGAVGRELNRLCWLTRAYLIRLGRAVLLKIAPLLHPSEVEIRCLPLPAAGLLIF